MRVSLYFEVRAFTVLQQSIATAWSWGITLIKKRLLPQQQRTSPLLRCRTHQSEQVSDLSGSWTAPLPRFCSRWPIPLPSWHIPQLSPLTTIYPAPTQETSISQEQVMPVKRTGTGHRRLKNRYRSGKPEKHIGKFRQRLSDGPETTPAGRTSNWRPISRPPSFPQHPYTHFLPKHLILPQLRQRPPVTPKAELALKSPTPNLEKDSTKSVVMTVARNPRHKDQKMKEET